MDNQKIAQHEVPKDKFKPTVETPSKTTYKNREVYWLAGGIVLLLLVVIAYKFGKQSVAPTQIQPSPVTQAIPTANTETLNQETYSPYLDNSKEYVNQRYGFTLKTLPKNLIPVVCNEGDNPYKAGNPLESKSIRFMKPSTVEFYKERDKESGLQGYLICGPTEAPDESIEIQVYENGRLHVNQEAKMIKVDGFTAYQTMTKNAGGPGIGPGPDNITTTEILHNDYLFRISMYSDSEKFQNEYDQILSTFKFEDQYHILNTSNWKLFTNDIDNYSIKYPHEYEHEFSEDVNKNETSPYAIKSLNLDSYYQGEALFTGGISGDHITINIYPDNNDSWSEIPALDNSTKTILLGDQKAKLTEDIGIPIISIGPIKHNGKIYSIQLDRPSWTSDVSNFYTMISTFKFAN